MKYLKTYKIFESIVGNKWMWSINEYMELQPDIKNSKENNFILIDSISEVPKVGKPMNRENFKFDGISSLSWDNIVIVRASNETPIIKKGLMILPTSRSLKTMGWNDHFIKSQKNQFEKGLGEPGESWEEFFNNNAKIQGNRWTKHFTLNHLVQSHESGSWVDKSFTYLLPAKETVSLNGKPSSLYVIDTWYSKNVVLPKNTVVLYNTKVKDKVEQMSFEFNRDLNGDKLKYPIYFLEIKSQDEVDKVIQAMGYSVVEGGANYSKEDVEDEFRDFYSSENQVSMGPHNGTFWYKLEQNGPDHPSMVNLISNLRHLQNSLKDDDDLNKWYEDHRRIIKSYLDTLFQQETEKEIERAVTQLKEFESENRLRNFKNDVIKSLQKNNVKNLDKLITYYNSLLSST